MFEQVFKNIDDDLGKEAGCTIEFNFSEQSPWLLFLKCIADLEEDKNGSEVLTPKFPIAAKQSSRDAK